MNKNMKILLNKGGILLGLFGRLIVSLIFSGWFQNKTATDLVWISTKVKSVQKRFLLL